jgi:hypothetical protein
LTCAAIELDVLWNAEKERHQKSLTGTGPLIGMCALPFYIQLADEFRFCEET